MTEEWRDIKGYEGLYQVSSYGRIKALANPQMVHRPKSDKFMVLCNEKDGYKIVGLTDRNGTRITKRVHRLVAQAFIPNPNNLKEINHINEIKADNRVENLEWCDTKYNLTYGHRLDYVRGENSATAKLTERDVLEIRRTYKKGDLQYGQSALGKRYGVSHVSIAAIINGKSWKHLLTN